MPEIIFIDKLLGTIISNGQKGQVTGRSKSADRRLNIGIQFTREVLKNICGEPPFKPRDMKNSLHHSLKPTGYTHKIS